MKQYIISEKELLEFLYQKHIAKCEDLETYMNNKTKSLTDKIEKLEEELEYVRDKKRPEGCPYCLKYDWIDQKEVQKTSVEMENEYGHRCGRKLK